MTKVTIKPNFDNDWEMDAYSRMTAMEHLAQTVKEMERGDWAPQDEIVLLARTSGCGIVTICRWGDETNLLHDACWLKHNHGEEEIK